MNWSLWISDTIGLIHRLVDTVTNHYTDVHSLRHYVVVMVGLCCAQESHVYIYDPCQHS